MAYGLRKLDDLIFILNKPIIGKKGVHYQKLLKDWRLIIGDSLSNQTIPTKISSSRKGPNNIENILYIATNNAATATELMYHIGVIKEQVNFYFGYDYIQQIKFSQAVFKVNTYIEPITPKITPQQIQKIDIMTSEYAQDDEIKAILVNLATSMLQRR